MKDHPHLRGAAESYNSLKEAFLPALHLSRVMGAIAARASPHFCLHWRLIMHTRRHSVEIVLILSFDLRNLCKKQINCLFMGGIKIKKSEGSLLSCIPYYRVSSSGCKTVVKLVLLCCSFQQNDCFHHFSSYYKGLSLCVRQIQHHNKINVTCETHKKSP